MMMRDKYEEYACPGYACPACDHADAAITTLRKALAEPEKQVAWNWMLDGLPHGPAYYGPPPDDHVAQIGLANGRSVRLLYAAPPQREHITDGSPCWCNPDVIEEEGGNVIVHNYEDNWQQYAKPGETAQQCIERHRAEQDALMKLYATPRKPQTTHWEGCEAVHPECRKPDTDCHTQGICQRSGYSIAPTPRKPLKSVDGDVLPAVGSTVWIRHGRDTDAHACTVTGYCVWDDLGGNKNLHRVFVRLVYAGTDREQARMLKDCFATKEAALAAHGITGEQT